MVKNFFGQEIYLDEGTYTLTVNAKWSDEKGSTIEAIPYFYNSSYGWLKSSQHDTATSGLQVRDENVNSDTYLHTREFDVVTAGTYMVGIFTNYGFNNNVLGLSNAGLIKSTDADTNLLTNVNNIKKWISLKNKASVSSIIIDSGAQAVKPSISDVNEADHSVVLESRENYQYSIDKINWYDSTTFDNLQEGTIYTFYAKNLANDKISSGVKFAFPSTPKILLRGETVLKVEKDDGFEYSLDGENYSFNLEFGGLNANTEYTIYKRLSNSGYPIIKTASAVTDGDDLLPSGSAQALAFVRREILFGSVNFAADVSQDGVVNIIDLVRLKKILVNNYKLLEPQNKITNENIDGDYYLFFTDPHIGPTEENSSISQTSWNRLRELANWYKISGASFTLSGGDWLNDTNTKDDAKRHLSEIRANMTKYFGEKSYLVVGNHDYNYQYRNSNGAIVGSNYTLTATEIANSWNMENGKTYYSFKSNASRFYVFDSGTDWRESTDINDYDIEQLNWYIQSLTNNDDEHIVLAPHAVNLPVSVEAAKIAAIYNERGSYSFGGKTYDFSQKTGMVEYIIAGHEHIDSVGELSGIPYILTRTYKDGSSATADFVFANYTDRTLELIRLGEGESRTISLSKKMTPKLTNSLVRLNCDNELSVGYLGGSITVGVGSSDQATKSWRAKTTAWIKSNFPNATVTEINDAISNTGVAYGLYRAEDRYFSQNNGKAPDLNFLEFAINDTYEARSMDSSNTPNTDQYVYIESLINKIYKSNPKADIVFVITGDYGYWYNESTSETPVFGKAYRDLAEYYNISIVYPFRELVLDMVSQNDGNYIMPDSAVWKKYYPTSGDVVHPGDNGHAHFSNTITNYLANFLIPGWNIGAESAKNVILPATTYCAANNINNGLLYEDATILKTTDIKNKVTNGFTEAIDSLGNGPMKDCKQLISNAKGDTLTFTFDKQSIGIWTSATGDTTLTYRIDSGNSKTISLTARTSGELHILDENLGDGQHTITITHADSDAIAKVNYILSH